MPFERPAPSLDLQKSLLLHFDNEKSWVNLSSLWGQYEIVSQIYSSMMRSLQVIEKRPLDSLHLHYSCGSGEPGSSSCCIFGSFAFQKNLEALLLLHVETWTSSTPWERQRAWELAVLAWCLASVGKVADLAKFTKSRRDLQNTLKQIRV